MEPTLSTRKAAEYLQVDESTIKRWADKGLLKCSKTAGGHRRFSLSTLISSAEKLGMADSATNATIPGKANSKAFNAVKPEEFGKILITGQADSAFNVLLDSYINNLPLEYILDTIVSPAMSYVGAKWSTGEFGIEDEHISSQTLMSALYRFGLSLKAKKKTKGLVVCAGLEGEYHEIGLHCVKIFLEAEGWNVIFPGINLPFDSLSSLISVHKPDIVCITSSSQKVSKKLIDDLKNLNKRLFSSGSKLVVGGKAKLANIENIYFMNGITELKNFLNSRK